MSKPNRITQSLIRSLCEGLVANMTYESRCGMGNAMSEHLLYLPALRIAKHMKWDTRIEYATSKINANLRGDYPRIDFVAKRDQTLVAIELKWKEADGSKLTLLGTELKKFNQFRQLAMSESIQEINCYQLVVGRHNMKKESAKRKGTFPPPLSIGSKTILPALTIEFQASALHYYANAYLIEIEEIT